MSTQDPRRAQSGPALTALPRVEELPVADQGFDRARVQEAFDAFRRHVTSLQAQLRVLQAAPRSTVSEPSGHAVRMDALHVIRAAADFADTIERDAQEAAVKQVAKAEQEIRESQIELQGQEAEIARIRHETERQRGEILNAARNEARDLLTKTNRDSTQELREAEAKGARLLEQSRHQATELTNAARAEVEQTLEWARAQADVIVQRARMGAEQLLSAAGHGDAAIQEAVDAIVRAAEASVQSSRPSREVAEPPSATPSAPREATPTASKPASPPLRSATTPKPSRRAAEGSPSPDEDEPPKTA
jgi:predicted ribosome quality control (RQC) complex YloA/Tae2 family protein